VILPDEVERSWERVNFDGPPPSAPWQPVEGGCWLWWAGKTKHGYGTFCPRARVTFAAHRYAYEITRGPIPRRLVLNHLCRVSSCVNPAHLEPVTQRENVRRGIKGDLTTCCPHGHPYTRANTYIHKGRRHCRACNAERQRARRRAA
jgi:hypothetical protein